MTTFSMQEKCTKDINIDVISCEILNRLGEDGSWSKSETVHSSMLVGYETVRIDQMTKLVRPSVAATVSAVFSCNTGGQQYSPSDRMIL